MRYPPQEFSALTEIGTASFNLELAIGPLTSTQTAVQIALNVVIDWLNYAKANFIKGKKESPKLKKIFYELIEEVTVLIYRLQKLAANVPLQTTPLFGPYKAEKIYNVQGEMGRLYYKTWRVLVESLEHCKDKPKSCSNETPKPKNTPNKDTPCKKQKDNSCSDSSSNEKPKRKSCSKSSSSSSSSSSKRK